MALAVLCIMSSVTKPRSLERTRTHFYWILIMVRVVSYWKNWLSAFHMKGQSAITIMPQSTWWSSKLFEDLLLNLPSNITLVGRLDIKPSRHWFTIMPLKPNTAVSWSKGWICCKNQMGWENLSLRAPHQQSLSNIWQSSWMLQAHNCACSLSVANSWISYW